MPKSSDAKPWERQDGESAKAYQAFCKYLDMGEKRSIRAVAQQLGKSATLMARWSSTWHWPDRVAEYEADLRRQTYKKAQNDAEKMAKRHINIALKMQEKALAALNATKPEYIQVRDMITLLREATKLERDSRVDVETRTAPLRSEQEVEDDLVNDWIAGVIAADAEDQ